MDFVTILFGVAVVIFLIWLSNSVYVIKEWERGVVLRLGRMLPEAKGAGLQLVFFPIDKLTRISLRIETLDVPPQDVITRDNVSVKVNAVCYFRVVDANLALSQVQNYLYATSQLAQTTLRSLIGQFELRYSGEYAARHRAAGGSRARAPRQSNCRRRRISSLGEIIRSRGSAAKGANSHPAALFANAGGNWRREKHHGGLPTAGGHHFAVDEVAGEKVREWQATQDAEVATGFSRAGTW
jgi:hypothetical protein